MDGALLRNRGGAPVDASHIDELMDGFHGRIILPNHRDYDDARRIWNASIDKRPGVIARCAGVADVVQAVQFAYGMTY